MKLHTAIFHFASFVILILLMPSAPLSQIHLTDEQAVDLARKYAKQDKECQPIIAKYPKILEMTKNQFLNLTRKDTPPRPVIEKQNEIYKIDFCYFGHIHDSPNYIIEVYIRSDGSLSEIKKSIVPYSQF